MDWTCSAHKREQMNQDMTAFKNKKHDMTDLEVQRVNIK